MVTWLAHEQLQRVLDTSEQDSVFISLGLIGLRVADRLVLSSVNVRRLVRVSLSGDSCEWIVGAILA